MMHSSSHVRRVGANTGHTPESIGLCYGAAHGYPCTRVNDDLDMTRSPTWRGLSHESLRACAQGAQKQTDFWSCAANSAARIAVGLTGQRRSAVDYGAFRDTMPTLDLQQDTFRINAFFKDGSGAIGRKVAEALPRFGPTAPALAGHVAAYLGVQVGLLDAAKPQVCAAWLVRSVGPACAAVVLMCYGHFAMHYVALLGLDVSTRQALLLETDGNLYTMDLDVLIACMDADGTAGLALGYARRYNGVRLSV